MDAAAPWLPAALFTALQLAYSNSNSRLQEVFLGGLMVQALQGTFLFFCFFFFFSFFLFLFFLS